MSLYAFDEGNSLKGCDSVIAVAFWWSYFSHLSVESNSTNVVAWFKDMSLAHWRFKNIIKENVHRFDGHISWSISDIRCTGNDATDVLTHIGAHGFSFIFSVVFWVIVCIFSFSRPIFGDGLLFFFFFLNKFFLKNSIIWIEYHGRCI